MQVNCGINGLTYLLMVSNRVDPNLNTLNSNSLILCRVACLIKLPTVHRSGETRGVICESRDDVQCGLTEVFGRDMAPYVFFYMLFLSLKTKTFTIK
jgi:hypothetical protein